MKYHKYVDIILSEDLSIQKDSCLWGEKWKEFAESQVAYIRKSVRLFLTGLVLAEVALPWRLWLQSMGRTVHKKPLSGCTKCDGSEMPQVGDTRRGGSFVSSFFVWSTCSLLGSLWCIAPTIERQANSFVKLRHLLYPRGYCRNGHTSRRSRARVHMLPEMLFQFAAKQYIFGV